MKKIFLTIATAALLSANVFAADGGKKSNETASNVSYAAQQEFTTDFAGAKDINWTVTKNCQKVDFTIDGAKKTAFYSLAGDFLGTTQVVAYNAIPAKTQKLIADNYKGYTANNVIVYQANEALNADIEPTSYFVDLKNDAHELLVRVTGEGSVEFFKQVK
jgi:formyltetrahydrofolate synthetase